MRPGKGNPPSGRHAAAKPSNLIFGRNAVLEAARVGRLRRVMVAEGVGPDPRIQELATLVQLEQVPATKLDAMVSGLHQGVVAELGPRKFHSLKDLLALAPSLLVALDGVQDPQNLGAILRSAEAAGAAGAILPERRAAPLSAVAVKASSGASEHLPLCQVSGIAAIMPEVQRAGIWCVALDPEGDCAPWDVDLAQPVCLVVGGEGGGVHRLVRERCDFRVKLPMAGRIASLNASAAAAVVLFEIVRQREGLSR